MPRSPAAVEDDAPIRSALIRSLSERGHAVVSVPTAMAALQQVTDSPPDLVILDLGLPDMDGYQVLRMMRAVSAVPVIVATARDDESEIVKVLDAGADDYMVKPFGPGQVDARIRAVLRRVSDDGDGGAGPVVVGGLRLDLDAREATLDRVPLDLSPREFDLLYYLAARAGQVVTKRELLDAGLAHALWRSGQDGGRAPGVAAAQAGGERAAAPVSAHGARCRDQARHAVMRIRLVLLVVATSSLVLVAFFIPLALLLRTVAADRAVNKATVEAQSLAPLVATLVASSLSLAVEQINGQSGALPVTVFLPGGRTLGRPAPRSPAVELAASGSSITAEAPGGREVLVAVAGLPGGTVVIRTFVPDSELRRGVTRSWLVLGAVGLGLLALSAVVADQLARSLVRPLAAVARASHQLASGDLSVRAALGGPPEVIQVGTGLNLLGARIGELLARERETVADMSHRLRTPLTVLRVDAESLSDPHEMALLNGDVDALERTVNEIIHEARRPVREGVRAACEAARVVRERAAFWSPLAGDQERWMSVEVVPGPVPVRVAHEDLATCVDTAARERLRAHPGRSRVHRQAHQARGRRGVHGRRRRRPGFHRRVHRPARHQQRRIDGTGPGHRQAHGRGIRRDPDPGAVTSGRRGGHRRARPARRLTAFRVQTAEDAMRRSSSSSAAATDRVPRPDGRGCHDHGGLPAKSHGCQYVPLPLLMCFHDRGNFSAVLAEKLPRS